MKASVPPEHRLWTETLPKRGDAADLCPVCEGKSSVIKRGYVRGGMVARYRKCQECGYKYKTVELLAFGDQVSLRDLTRDRTERRKPDEQSL